MGVSYCGRGNDLSSWLTPLLCQAYTVQCSYTSACVEASAEVEGCHMDGLLLDHFQQLMVILYYDVPAINVGMELLQTETYQQTLLLNGHIASLYISKGFTGKWYGVNTLY